MKALRSAGGIVLTILVLLGIWLIALQLSGLNRVLLPAPTDVWRAASHNQSKLLSATWTTAKGAFGGFLVGNIVGVLLAIVVARSVLASRVVLPLAIAIRVVPVVAMAPLLTMVIGRGLVTVVTIAGLLVFFPTLINGILGLRSVKPEQIDMMRMANASQWHIFVHVRLPAAMPSLFAAFRVAAAASVLGAMLAEWVASGAGLGYLILRSSLTFEVGLMWAAVIVAVVITVGAAAFTGAIGRRVVRWEASD
jgi:NitT/TauT family transport system permease protein